MTGETTGMNYLRAAKTRNGSEVRIVWESDSWVAGFYLSDSPKRQGFIPCWWPKHTPFYNGTKASGLDLMEDYGHLIV